MTNNHEKILIVEDEASIREILQFNLEYEGYQIDDAASAEEALKILSPGHSLILLDVMMGNMSGFKMADILRKEGNTIPIIFLTAKDTENDMLTGFSIGGDDYIKKPFSIKEVIARVKSVLKRVNEKNNSQSKNLIEYDGLSINLTSKIVKVDSVPIELTKTEFSILQLLVENENKIFSRSEILNKAWKDDSIVLERTVDVHLARLRKKIGRFGDAIYNRVGYGYVFSFSKSKN